MAVFRKRFLQMIFLTADLERLGETALQEFNARVRPADTSAQPSAERLEAKLEQLYGIAVTLAQRQDEICEVAAIWEQMVKVCDRIAKALSADATVRSLKSYDRILDIRNACEENRALHA